MNESKIKRNKEIKIRLTDEEHQALKDRCTKSELATWMRETCLGEKKTKKSLVQEVDPKLLRQLTAIGNNLNQIARTVNQMNQSGKNLDSVSLIATLMSIEREIKAIKNDSKNTQ